MVDSTSGKLSTDDTESDGNGCGSETVASTSGAGTADEKASLLHKSSWRKVERWYILLLFSSLSLFQSAIWTTYSPITDTVEHIFGWNDANIAIINNWDPVTFLCTAWFFGILLDRYGLRFSVLVSSFFVLTAAIVRCIYVSDSPLANTIIQNAVEVFDALGGVIYGAPTVISALWFPPAQRTLATSVVLVTATLGNAIPYVLEPALIQYVNNTNQTDAQNVEKARSELYSFFYVNCAVVGVLVVCALVHFPAKPRTAPSVSATQKREPFFAGLRILSKSRAFWGLLTSYSLVVGVTGSWASLLYIVLRPLDVYSESHVGWLGFATSVVQATFSLAFGSIADSYPRYSKRIILSTLLISATLFACFGLMANKILPFNIIVFDICVVAATSLASAAMPNYFELTNEVCFPVSEASCSLVLTAGNEITGSTLYLLVTGLTVWLDASHTYLVVQMLFWTPFVSVLLAAVSLAFVKQSLNRMTVDQGAAAASSIMPVAHDDRTPLLINQS